MFTAKPLTVGPNTMTSIWSAMVSSCSGVTPMLLAASSIASLSPESITSRNDIDFQSSGTGKRMPDLGASTHSLPAGGAASVGGADAGAVADVDAEPPADAVVASVGGEPPHPDRAR